MRGLRAAASTDNGHVRLWTSGGEIGVHRSLTSMFRAQGQAPSSASQAAAAAEASSVGKRCNDERSSPAELCASPAMLAKPPKRKSVQEDEPFID